MTGVDGLQRREELIAELAEEYARWTAAPYEPDQWQLDSGDDLAHLLPVVTAYAEQQARQRAAGGHRRPARTARLERVGGGSTGRVRRRTGRGRAAVNGPRTGPSCRRTDGTPSAGVVGRTTLRTFVRNETRRMR